MLSILLVESANALLDFALLDEQVFNAALDPVHTLLQLALDSRRRLLDSFDVVVLVLA